MVVKKITTYGSVENGKLKILKREEFLASLKNFDACRVEVSIKKIYKKRSNEQNKYYWGVIVELWRQIILSEWGEYWNSNEVHEFLKFHFNSEEKIVNNGILRLPKSTTENDTAQQEEFHSICRMKANEMFGIIIPLPNEREDFINENI